MGFIKKYRRLLLFLILYATLFLLGFNIHDVLKNGLDSEVNVLIQLSGILSKSLLSLAIFWYLYIVKIDQKIIEK